MTFCDLFPGSNNPYLHVADEWISNAFRQATRRQHSYVVRLFVGLAVKLRLNYYRPSEELVVSFLAFLLQNYKTQKVVRSMFSTLKACLRRAYIDVAVFEATRASLFVRSIGINKRTPTLQRPPIDASTLRLVVSHWRRNHKNGLVLAAAAIMMFVTSLRQSNLFPTSKLSFDASRQLVWADVRWRKEYINVRVKWGKAQQKTSTRFQRIPRAQRGELCLASALEMIRHPRQRGHDPIFAFPDKSPIPISFASKAWSAAVAAIGMEPVGFTMHSLRRGVRGISNTWA